MSGPLAKGVEPAVRVPLHDLRCHNQPGPVEADACHAPDLHLWLRGQLACCGFLQGGVDGVQHARGHGDRWVPLYLLDHHHQW